MARDCFAGVMSGTSLDGVDAVVADFAPSGGKPCKTLGAAHVGLPTMLRDELLALQLPGKNELARAGSAANMLAELYADAIAQALAQAKLTAGDIKAAGVHGQTLRHRPDLGITVQFNNRGAGRGKGRHERRGGFPQSRRRRRWPRRAAGPGVPCGTVRAERSASRDRQHRRHRQHDRSAAGRSGARLRHRAGERAIGPVVRAQSRCDVRCSGAWAATERSFRALLDVLLADPFFERAAAEEHAIATSSTCSGSRKSSARRARRRKRRTCRRHSLR